MRRKLRLILDAIIALSVLTLFSKNLFGLQYHELVGLGVLIPIIVHIMINVRVICNMRRNFQKVPVTIKVCLVIDILLIVIFAWMGISGALISKIVFTSSSGTSMTVKAMHKMLGKASICILGIHMGLHLCRVRLKTWVATALTVVAVVSLVVGALNTQGGHARGQRDMDMYKAVSGATEKSEMSRPPEKPDLEGNEENSNTASGGNNNFSEEHRHGHMNNQSNTNQKAFIIAKAFGLMSCFTMATYWIVYFSKRRKKTEKEQTA